MGKISRVYAAELDGIDATLVEVETDINVGLHSFTIVGLVDKALSEAKERVNSALKNSGVKPPTRENRRIVVNLAPADVKKSGSQYDVAIAVGYLLASDQMKDFETRDKLFLGELSLRGDIRSVPGILNCVHFASEAGFKSVFVPVGNASEASVVSGVTVIPVANLAALIAHLEERVKIPAHVPTAVLPVTEEGSFDISEVKGQENAKRALMIAASGGHNMLMVGPPGTGKSMLAQALNSILPLPSPEEIIEVTKIYSAAGLLKGMAYLGSRPFRSPHQTASPAAIVGGGQNPRPGEISLAHRGVLFLDELPEFRRDILEALRQPLESGQMIVSRVKNNLFFPCRFILVAAMNPCPCGYYGDEEKECRCAAYEVLRYQKKISGPLLDRIDLQVTVPRVKIATLRKKPVEENESRIVRARVTEARETQRKRFVALGLKKRYINSELTSKECELVIKLDPPAEHFLKEVFDKSLLSARGYYRILKVAQTIADLETSPQVTEAHLAEAFSYRLRDKE